MTFRHRTLVWPSRLTLAVVLLVTALLTLTRVDQRCASASSTPGDWCYRTNVFITNGTGGDLDRYLVRIANASETGLVDAASLINTARMDARGWDLRPYIGSYATEAEMVLNDFDSSAAGWWAMLPDFDNGATVTLSMLTGTSDHQRDQGIPFENGGAATDRVFITGHADFDLTDNFAVRVKLEMNDATEAAQTATLFNRWTGNQGYRLLLVDSGGLAVRAQVDTTTLDYAWDSTWTGEPTWLEMRYVDPNLTIWADGVQVATTATGGGAIAVGSVNPEMGTSLDQSVIRGVEVIDLSGPTYVAVLGFDPRSGESPAAICDTTDAVGPVYVVTCPDYSGNGHSGMWEITAAQTNITVTVGPTAPTNATPLLVVAGVTIDTVGSPFSTTLFPGTSENENSPLWDVFDAASGSVIPRQMLWAIILFTTALIFGGVAIAAVKSVPIGIAAGGAPIGYGVVNGYIEPWMLLLWVAAAVMLWGVSRWSSEAA